MPFDYPIINSVKKVAQDSKKSFFEQTKGDSVTKPKLRLNLNFLRIIPKKVLSDRKFLFGFVLIVTILLGILASPIRGKFLNIFSGEKEGNLAEIDALLQEVGEKVLLSSDEKPTVATISDIAKLENQPFFREAKNGDKLIIYAGIRKAILYRPEIKKIIEISTIGEGESDQTNNAPNLSEPTLTPTPIVEAEEKVIKIVILNGTKEGGLAKKASDILEGDSIEIVSTGNAKEDYQTTSISSVDTSNPISESKLKEAIKGITKVTPDVVSLPEGETKPSNADAVLILGDDFAEQY